MNEKSAKVKDNQEVVYDCAWKDCDKNHTKKPKYNENGDVDRNTSYESDWVEAGLEPWKLHEAGTNSHATYADYKKETPAANYLDNAANMKYPEYHTQKHHLISVNLFSNVSKLSHNAKLIGYDVNHKKNGICLPSYIVDIVQHDLQCHRGSHPNALYNDKVDPFLRNLEIECIRYCKTDYDGDTSSQEDLIDELNALSDQTEIKIKKWEWLLRTKAIQERENSKERLRMLGDS